jgi:hypothetical protein
MKKILVMIVRYEFGDERYVLALKRYFWGSGKGVKTVQSGPFLSAVWQQRKARKNNYLYSIN